MVTVLEGLHKNCQSLVINSKYGKEVPILENLCLKGEVSEYHQTGSFLIVLLLFGKVNVGRYNGHVLQLRENRALRRNLTTYPKGQFLENAYLASLRL